MNLKESFIRMLQESNYVLILKRFVENTCYFSKEIGEIKYIIETVAENLTSHFYPEVNQVT